jgi:hypothetical protein
MIKPRVHMAFNLLVREAVRIRDEYNSTGHRDKEIKEKELKELDKLKETISLIQREWK